MSNSIDLALVAGQTVKQLGEIWDVLGEPANERERHVQALCAEVVAVYNNLLAAQRSRVADAQARIDRYASTMRSLSLELAEPTPPVLPLTKEKLAVNHFFSRSHPLPRSPQDDGNCVPLLVRGDRLKHALDALQSKRTS
jgi:hypothetical protein